MRSYFRTNHWWHRWLAIADHNPARSKLHQSIRRMKSRTGCTGSETGHLFNVEGITSTSHRECLLTSSPSSTTNVQSWHRIRSPRGTSTSLPTTRTPSSRSTIFSRGLFTMVTSVRLLFPSWTHCTDGISSSKLAWFHTSPETTLIL